MAPLSMRRRRFLGVLAAGAVTAGCSGEAEEGRQPSQEDAGTPTSLREAPILAERVAAGDLPPVEERLPKEPYVIEPGALVDPQFVNIRSGPYGGTLQLAQESPTFDPHIFIGNVEPLLWSPGGFPDDEPIGGNVLAGYEANDDDTVFTFHMREGLRWSDGELVTVDDVQFAYEDVLLNEEITPVFPSYLRTGQRADGPPAELRIIDDLTFSLTFSEPYGTFPVQIAIALWRSYADLIKPVITWSSSTRVMRSAMS